MLALVEKKAGQRVGVDFSWEGKYVSHFPQIRRGKIQETEGYVKHRRGS